MNVALPTRMTVDEFLVWSERQPKGRYELFDGRVVMQQSERWVHLRIKGEVFAALRSAVRVGGSSCYVVTDGATVRIDERTSFQPDALVAPLPEPDPDSLEIPNPIVVVEVLSPSTAQVDASTKLRGYFRVPSVVHYLIVDPDDATITHHKRGSGSTIETRVVETGTLELDPPGVSFTLAEIFGSR